MAWNLCSKADVISIHPTNETALQDFWSDTVEALIREHLRAPNLGTQVTITGELYDGENTPILLVKSPPIVQVTELLINNVLISSAEYIATANGIELVGSVFPEGQKNISLSYVSGSTNGIDGKPLVDPIIRMTAAAMIVAILQYRQRAGADGSIKWGQADQLEGEKTPTYNAGLTSHMKTIMRRMLRRTSIRIK